MAFKIFVRPGWPNQGFRRAGMDFTKDVPVIVDELTPGLEKEKAKADENKSALVFVEIDGADVPADGEDVSEAVFSFDELSQMKVAELRELAESENIQISANAKKAEIVDTLAVAFGGVEDADGEANEADVPADGEDGE